MKKYIRADIVDINDDTVDAHFEVAKNPNTRPGTLRKLYERYKHKASSIVPWIACNPNTPLDILQDILNLGVLGWKAAVAANPNIPDSLLNELLSDPRIIEHLMCFPGTPSTLLTTICSEHLQYLSNSLCTYLLRHPNLPENTRKELTDKWDANTCYAFDFTTEDPDFPVDSLTRAIDSAMVQLPLSPVTYKDTYIELIDRYDDSEDGSESTYSCYVGFTMFSFSRQEQKLQKDIESKCEEVLESFGIPLDNVNNIEWEDYMNDWGVT